MEHVTKQTSRTDGKQASFCKELQEIIRRARTVKNDRILRLPKLKEKIGRANATIWRDVESRVLPPPFSIGARSVGWRESEIDAWIDAKAFASRAGIAIDIRAFVASLIEPVVAQSEDWAELEPIQKNR